MESNVNLFQSAYFGKAYKTRDGRKAIYIQEDCYIVEGNRDIFSYFDDGHCRIPLEDCDIVSDGLNLLMRKNYANKVENMQNR